MLCELRIKISSGVDWYHFLEKPVSAKVHRYIYCVTTVTFGSLYAAQPIQPVFQSEFQLSALQAILFTTLMMAPLSVAPLFYGFLLEAVSARQMVRCAVFLLGVLELFFAISGNYVSLLAIRAVQGLLIPAILTGIMSYVSYTNSRASVQRAIASYIAATIAGGFLGRFLSGLCTDLFGWRFFFAVLGLLLIVCSFLLKAMVRDVKMQYARPGLPDLYTILRQPGFFWLYATIFCLFFVFAALMNYIPFQLKALRPEIAETSVGLLYLGYSMGILVSLNSVRIIAWSRGAVPAIVWGVLLFMLGEMLFFVENYGMMFVAMFVFCAGLFTAHSQLSGFLSTLAKSNKAIVNGLYLSFYYAGGTLGSLLPGAIYEAWGWKSFLVFLFLMIGAALFFTFLLQKASSS